MEQGLSAWMEIDERDEKEEGHAIPAWPLIRLKRSYYLRFGAFAVPIERPFILAPLSLPGIEQATVP